jgi:hypothetical protein
MFFDSFMGENLLQPVGLPATFVYQRNLFEFFRLSNAFKYTTKGKITVSVTYDFAFAYLRVCDTGEL